LDISADMSGHLGSIWLADFPPAQTHFIKHYDYGDKTGGASSMYDNTPPP